MGRRLEKKKKRTILSRIFRRDNSTSIPEKVVIGIIAVSVFGAGIIILFGDVIVCAAIIIFIINKIIKNFKEL